MKNYYVVTHKSNADNHHSYIPLCIIAHSKPNAWKKFLTLVGKDVQYWKKLGYRAEKIRVEIRFE